MNPVLPFYKRLLFEDLQVSKGFLEKHAPIVAERFQHAAEGLQQPQGAAEAVNDCFHVASSMVLRGSHRVRTTLDRLGRNPRFTGKDPTTIVTVAALYYLFHQTSSHSKSRAVQQAVARLRCRFADLDWLVGPQAMKALGIRRTPANGCSPRRPQNTLPRRGPTAKPRPRTR